MKDKIEKIIKSNSLINKTFTLFGSLVLKVLGLFVKNEEKSVLFVSYMGKSFNDSPKKIFDEMISDEFFKDYKIYWAFKDIQKFKVPENVNIVKMDSLQYFKTALKTSAWITNVNIERGLHFKKKNTCYINTWHGIPLKNIGNDVKGRNDFNFSGISYFPYSGKFEKNIYLRAFKVNESNLKLVGMPRNDILISGNDTIKEKVRANYHVEGKKIILYAPTWRDDENDLPPLDLALWKKLLDSNYVLFLRSHGLVEKFDEESREGVIDVSDYEETSDLLVASDILVTDYSSIMFDYSLTKKPIIIYAPDFNKYNSERGMYFDLKSKSLSVYESESELVTALESIDTEIEVENTIRFCEEFFDYKEANSTNSIIEFLKDWKW